MEKSNCNHYEVLIQNIGDLFFDESRKDVTFVFLDSDEKITAHKIILEAASPVFKAMFSGNFAEKEEITIDDICPEVFKLLLSGIYMNDIHSQVKSERPIITYIDLYYAAEKYDIKDIRELSKKFIIDNCHDGNTHLLLEKAKLFNLPDLEAKCKDVFQNETYYVLASHISLYVNGRYFHECFDLEYLAVKTEFDLYMFLQALVDNQILLDYSKFLSKIRFLTINTIDILSCELLSDKEKIAVISNIEAKKFQKTPKYPMPGHLSAEHEPRKLSYVKMSDRQYFWTAIMMKSDKYEDYFEDFFKQMNIPANSRERTTALIQNGRKETDEEGLVPHDVIHKITKSIFLPQ